METAGDAVSVADAEAEGAAEVADGSEPPSPAQAERHTANAAASRTRVVFDVLFTTATLPRTTGPHAPAVSGRRSRNLRSRRTEPPHPAIGRRILVSEASPRR
ncbi:hypothetical protein GCM10014719_06330 [Planomonospora parontospora subsp. antibiotica]|nr:hypothetical protein GCM10014719_06330 [Planomonospora parontospora subsp. antibiotica]GII14151.1 hypothetical protein Ppa05_08770 [Planomonospora parontospora subsp. antibiotica]